MQQENNLEKVDKAHMGWRACRATPKVHAASLAARKSGHKAAITPVPSHPGLEPCHTACGFRALLRISNAYLDANEVQIRLCNTQSTLLILFFCTAE